MKTFKRCLMSFICFVTVVGAFYLSEQVVGVKQKLDYTILFLLICGGTELYLLIRHHQAFPKRAQDNLIFGLILLLLSGYCMLQILHLKGWEWALWPIMVSAFGEGMAFIVGRSIPNKWRVLIAPTISPNKTIFGTLAFLMAGSIAGFAWWYCLADLATTLPRWWAITVVIITVFSACLADFTISALKRAISIKVGSGKYARDIGGIKDSYEVFEYYLKPLRPLGSIANLTGRGGFADQVISPLAAVLATGFLIIIFFSVKEIIGYALFICRAL